MLILPCYSRYSNYLVPKLQFYPRIYLETSNMH